MNHHDGLADSNDPIEELRAVDFLEAFFSDGGLDEERKNECKEEHGERINEA